MTDFFDLVYSVRTDSIADVGSLEAIHKMADDLQKYLDSDWDGDPDHLNIDEVGMKLKEMGVLDVYTMDNMYWYLMPVVDEYHEDKRGIITAEVEKIYNYLFTDDKGKDIQFDDEAKFGAYRQFLSMLFKDAGVVRGHITELSDDDMVSEDDV